jgi:hypothetical protein
MVDSLPKNCQLIYQPDTKYTQNPPHLTVESRSDNPLLAGMPRTFKKYYSKMAEFISRDMKYFNPNAVFQLI